MTMRSRISDAAIAPPLLLDDEKRLSEVEDRLLTPSDTDRDSPSNRKRAEVNFLSIGGEEEANPGPPSLREGSRVVIEIEGVPIGPLSTVFPLPE